MGQLSGGGAGSTLVTKPTTPYTNNTNTYMTLTISTSGGTFGPWVVALNSAGEELLLTGLAYTGNVNTNITRIQFGFGASGSEIAVAEIIAATQSDGYVPLTIPLRVPSGTRITCRATPVSFLGSSASINVTPMTIPRSVTEAI